MNFEPFRTKDISLEMYQFRAAYKRKVKKIIFSNKKLLKAYLQCEQEILDYKKRKMWYGKIVFEILQHYVYGIPSHQEINIIYIRQMDTPKINNTFLHDFFRKKKWQRTKVNIASLLTTLFILICFIIQEIYNFFYANFPAFVCRLEVFDFALKLSLELLFSNSFEDAPFIYTYLNLFSADIITKFCLHFNLVF